MYVFTSHHARPALQVYIWWSNIEWRYPSFHVSLAHDEYKLLIASLVPSTCYESLSVVYPWNMDSLASHCSLRSDRWMVLCVSSELLHCSWDRFESTVNIVMFHFSNLSLLKSKKSNVLASLWPTTDFERYILSGTASLYIEDMLLPCIHAVFGCQCYWIHIDLKVNSWLSEVTQMVKLPNSAPLANHITSHLVSGPRLQYSPSLQVLLTTSASLEATKPPFPSPRSKLFFPSFIILLPTYTILDTFRTQHLHLHLLLHSTYIAVTPFCNTSFYYIWQPPLLATVHNTQQSQLLFWSDYPLVSLSHRVLGWVLADSSGSLLSTASSSSTVNCLHRDLLELPKVLIVGKLTPVTPDIFHAD